MAKVIRKLVINGEEYNMPSGDITSSNHTYDDIVHLSQAEYEALENKDPNTMYSTPDDESGAFLPENEENPNSRPVVHTMSLGAFSSDFIRWLHYYVSPNYLNIL